MTMENIIDTYIGSSKVNQKERLEIENLLKNKFMIVLKEIKGNLRGMNLVPKNEKIKIQESKAQVHIEDAARTVLNRETRSKQKTAERLRGFISYLNEYYDINIDVEALLPRVFSYEAERQLDLLKMLHESQSKEKLMDLYAISDKTLRSDLGALECGKSFFGQEIKIDRLEGRELNYVSSVHPIFMALNLSEIFTLTIGLMKLGENTPMKATYHHMAQVIYNQLSPYAKKLIKERGEEQGIYFQEDRGYRGYRQEKACKEQNKESALIYAVKSGQVCQITYKMGDRIFQQKGCLKWREQNQYELMTDIQNQKGFLIDGEQILDIQIEYK